MAIERYPILIWQDAQEQFTACSVQHYICAAGDSRGAALEELKKYFEFALQKISWNAGSDIIEAELAHYKVQVRPEYRDEAKRIHTTDPIGLLVPCVFGKLANGMRYCSVPTMAVWFSYNTGDNLKEAVNHYVQQALRERTPEQIARYLPPQNITLDEIVVHAASRRHHRNDLKLENISVVAEAMSDRQFRSGIARPWGREAEVTRLVAALTREKTSIILVGGTGSGKTAMLTEAVRKIEPTLEQLEHHGGHVPRFWLTAGPRHYCGHAVPGPMAGTGGSPDWRIDPDPWNALPGKFAGSDPGHGARSLRGDCGVSGAVSAARRVAHSRGSHA